jgi:hypothetical protein
MARQAVSASAWNDAERLLAAHQSSRNLIDCTVATYGHDYFVSSFASQLLGVACILGEEYIITLCEQFVGKPFTAASAGYGINYKYHYSKMFFVSS